MIILEYIWLDANLHLRSKQRSFNDYNVINKFPTYNILTMDTNLKQKLLSELPIWNYDGSSTGQATTESSEIQLIPINIMNNPFTNNDIVTKYYVLCETYDVNGLPALGNDRKYCVDIQQKGHLLQSWFGLEQEFFLFDMDTKQPVNWTKVKNTTQGEYYCGVNRSTYKETELMNSFFKLALSVGISMSGINQEVAPAQWEYQIGPLSPIECADQMYFAKYILFRLCQQYGMYAVFHPKPLIGDWNGSGCHVNMSNIITRTICSNDEHKSIKHIKKMCEVMKDDHANFIDNYSGTNNNMRLTGKHETSNINDFSYSIGGRHSSVRIPTTTVLNKCGYFEDRRPGSSINYYKILAKYVEYMISVGE